MAQDDLIGQHIGHYRVLEKIGQGGMAEVYKCIHTALRRHVAIKVMGRDLKDDPTLNQRFLREAQAIAQLRHPNIVQVYDFGTFEGGHYIVMEYIEGTDLRAEIDRRHRDQLRFSPEEILGLLGNIGGALDYAHARGVVHRDVKPGNILINTEGEAFLSDFGLALLRDRVSQATLGHSFGTPEYIAPEQAMDSRSATARSDIYSLGGILYEMATGELPFEAESALSLALKHISEDPTPPRSHAPDMPRSVEAVILKALAKDPAKRYATAHHLFEALHKAWGRSAEETTTLMTTGPTAAARPGFTPPPPPSGLSGYKATPPPTGAPPPPTLAHPVRSAPQQEKKRRWPGIALIVIAVMALIGGIAGYIALRNDKLPFQVGILATQETVSPELSATETKTLSPTSTVPASPTATDLPPTPTPSPAPTNTVPPNPTATPSPTLSPTAPAPTATPSPSPSPTLAPGATIVREADGMTLHYVPGGEFQMGASEEDEDASKDEWPQHTLDLAPFWMDETEVTIDQYRLCVDAGACEAPYTRTSYDNPARADHPMTYISWEEAAAYCAWIATETGWDAALPTEAQWEMAASWDPFTETKRRFPWGDDVPTTASGYVRFGDRTSPVGSAPAGASAYGILDLAGNAWEWVADWYDKDSYKVCEQSPKSCSAGEYPTTGQYRVMRGGAYDSFGSALRQLRATHREVGAPASTSERPAKGPNLGFRCVVNGERLP